MSSSPQTETYEVTLSRDEQWVVHHVLSNRLDEALDGDETPPEWVLESLEAVEADAETQLTGSQADRLYTALTAYVDREDAPEGDVVHGSAVLDALEGLVEP